MNFCLVFKNFLKNRKQLKFGKRDKKDNKNDEINKIGTVN